MFSTDRRGRWQRILSWLKRAPRALRRVVEFMHANMDKQIGLKDLADCAGLSLSHFSFQFRASTNQSPHQYMLRLRVERSKELLAVPASPFSTSDWKWGSAINSISQQSSGALWASRLPYIAPNDSPDHIRPLFALTSLTRQNQVRRFSSEKNAKAGRVGDCGRPTVSGEFIWKFPCIIIGERAAEALRNEHG